jgi:cellulose 1,4-beta-cellobiosidase
MHWLNSPYPTDADPTKPGVARGTCSITSGKPADVESQTPGATVTYSNIKTGPFGSTYSGTLQPGGSPGTPGGSSSSSSSRASSSSTRVSSSSSATRATTTTVRTSTTTTSSKATTTTAGGNCAAKFGQCGVSIFQNCQLITRANHLSRVSDTPVRLAAPVAPPARRPTTTTRSACR